MPVYQVLTGKALLKKCQELTQLSRSEIAKQCGYYSFKKEGKIRVNLAEFYGAILAAQGVFIDEKQGNLSRRVTVNKNRQIMINSSYTERMGLKPGDELEIKIGYKHISLKKIDNTQDQSAAWQSYLASEEEREEVYRRLANS